MQAAGLGGVVDDLDVAANERGRLAVVEVQELLQAIPAPSLPRYRRSPSGTSSHRSEQQMHDWVFASGMREGHILLLSYLGVTPAL